MDCKRSSSPRSAAVIGGNDDLLIEILLFLPAKSLIKFQSVSKHWRSLILSQRFSRLHTLHHHRRHQPRPSFLLRSSITSQFFVCQPNVKKLVPFRFEYRYLKILQSCNGLLLLECKNSPYGQKDYFVCNPTTRKYKKLVLSFGQLVRGLCIVFDPAKSPYYKVFCFTSYDDDRVGNEDITDYHTSTNNHTRQCSKTVIYIYLPNYKTRE
ncbi:hypothetical protein CDL12_13197 [Handroanthus impetiginosus]|uniref:F-box domain-containing protein n=1 Tax=Handroanthus impetiginosus TaxID=429701 RepID=A0A2G9H9I2_9LAMI|nr:hypothetical protein CDL12_13197 [Handroanthus impetiginosus]